MDPEKKARWIAALRSGRYRQGKRKLAHKMSAEDFMTHCCLGVLSELAVEDGIIEARNGQYGVTGIVRYYGADNNGWVTTALHPDVSHWAGLETSDDSLASDPKLFARTETDFSGRAALVPVSCSEANDGNTATGTSPQTFEQIADFIEANL